ncbi:hypothetical protein ACEUCK_06880 [Aeromonas veronii]
MSDDGRKRGFESLPHRQIAKTDLMVGFFVFKRHPDVGASSAERKVLLGLSGVAALLKKWQCRIVDDLLLRI